MEDLCRKAYLKKYPEADRVQQDRDLARHLRAIEDQFRFPTGSGLGSTEVFKWYNYNN